MFGLRRKKEDVVVPENKENLVAEEKKEEITALSADTNNVSDVKSMSVVGNEPLDNKEEKKEPAPITYKEIKALQRANYEKIATNFKTAYVLKNKKTNQIVEIRAASSFHACNIIGWRPKHVIVAAQRTIEDPPALPNETTSQSIDLPPALK